MKRIKLSVAALLVAGISYGQNNVKNNIKKNINNTHKEIEFRIDNLMSAIRMDMHYGRTFQEHGNYYFKELIKLKSINEDLIYEYWKLNSMCSCSNHEQEYNANTNIVR
jgi:hemerythrin superfamily protein